jgi:acetyl esterase
VSLDPQLAEVFAAFGRLTHADLLAPEGAARVGEIAASFLAEPPSSVRVHDDVVAGPHGPVPVRVYRPLDDEKARAAVVWLHGGGWMAGDLDMPEADHTSRWLAAEAGVVVVSVAYRLAVDGVHFPVPNDDVVAAFRWVVAQADELGVDAGSVFLGGASAGGNLAAGVAMRLRDDGAAAPTGLVLVYPLVHPELPPFATPVEEQLAQIPAVLRFPQPLVNLLVENFLGGPVQEAEAYAFAALGKLEGLPPTLLLVSEYDDLRSSGEAFAEGLRGAGVAVELVCERGVPHGHLNLPRLNGTRNSLTRICSWLRSRSSASSEQVSSEAAR